MKNVCGLALTGLVLTGAVTAQNSPSFPNFAATAPEFVAASIPIDVNRDGLTDLVGVGVDDQGRPVAQVALAAHALDQEATQGAFKFTATHLLGVSGQPGAAKCADVTGDGLPDLVAIMGPQGGTELHVSRGVETSPFFSVLLNLPIGVVGPFEVAELNGDGVLDVVVTALQGIHVLHGRGDGTFEPEVLVNPLSSIAAVGAGDFDGDGISEIVASSAFGEKLTVLRRDGVNSFGVIGEYAVPRSSDLVVADLDADGDDDIASSSSDADIIGVLLNDGSGVFAAPTLVDVPKPTRGIVAGDYNNDGIMDLVALHDGLVGLNEGPGLTVVSGLGGGNFTFTRFELTPSTMTSVTPVLLNGDFATDWVVSRPGSLTVNLGRPGTSKILAAMEPQSQSNGVRDLVLADLNGDGFDDRLARKANVLAVSLWQGGGFSNNDSLGAVEPFSEAGVGDFDGDGFADLVAGSEVVDTMFTYKGRGDGTFDPVEATIGSSAGATRAVVVGDLDGDGDDEVIVAVEGDTTNDAILIYEGKPGGGLMLAHTLGNVVSSGEVVQLLLHDLDRDGTDDLLILASDYFVRFRRGLAGSLDFETPVVGPFVPAPGQGSAPPLSLVAGRFELLGDDGVDEITVLMPGGLATLDGTPGPTPGSVELILRVTQKFPSFVTTGEMRAVAFDADSDGILELVVARPDFGRVIVYKRNEASSEWLLFATDVIESSARWLGAADLNGDDVLDFVSLGTTTTSFVGLSPLPWAISGGATAPISKGVPSFRASGDPSPGSPVRLEYRNGLPGVPPILVVGLDADAPFIPLQGGFVVPSPDLLIPLPLTDGLGDLSLDVTWTDFPPGIRLWTQVWQVAGPDTHASNTLTVESR